MRIAVYIGRDRPGLLAEITEAISSRQGNIIKAGFRLWQLTHRSSRSFLPSPSGNSCGTAIDRVARATVKTSQIAVLPNMPLSIVAMKRTVCCMCRVRRARLEQANRLA